MHELALAEGVLGVVLDAAAGDKVVKVCLEVGSLQFVDEASLQFGFELIAEETNAAGAQLELHHAPAVFRCKQCGAETEFRTPPFQCKNCSAFDLELLSGEQVVIEAIHLQSGSIINRPNRSVTEALEEHVKTHHANNTEHESDSQ